MENDTLKVYTVESSIQRPNRKSTERCVPILRPRGPLARRSEMKHANVYALVIVSVVFLLFCALFGLANA